MGTKPTKGRSIAVLEFFERGVAVTYAVVEGETFDGTEWCLALRELRSKTISQDDLARQHRGGAPQGNVDTRSISSDAETESPVNTGGLPSGERTSERLGDIVDGKLPF